MRKFKDKTKICSKTYHKHKENQDSPWKDFLSSIFLPGKSVRKQFKRKNYFRIDNPNLPDENNRCLLIL